MGTIYGQGDQVFLDKNEDNGFHECPKTCEAFRPRTVSYTHLDVYKRQGLPVHCGVCPPL